MSVTRRIVSQPRNRFSEAISLGEATVLARVQGVSEEWVVYVTESGRSFYVVHWPTDGPVEWLRRAASEVVETHLIEIPEMENLDSHHWLYLMAWEEAIDHAKQEARKSLVRNFL